MKRTLLWVLVAPLVGCGGAAPVEGGAPPVSGAPSAETPENLEPPRQPAEAEPNEGPADEPLPPSVPGSPPTVVAVSPQHGAQQVSTTSAISVAFSEPMNPTSVEAAFSLVPAATCAFRWNATGTELTCTPEAALQGELAYTVTVAAGAQDAGGEGLAVAFSASFTTGAPDTTPPTVLLTSPANAALGVGHLAPFQVQFSERMARQPTEAALSLSGSTGPLQHGELTWSDGDTVLRIYPPDASQWAFGEQVTLKLSADATDVSGNALSAPVDISFRVIRETIVNLPSQAALDGFIVEAQTGALTVNATAATLYLGDSAATNATGATRGFLSFDLSTLPEGAQVVNAVLGLYQTAQAGSPYQTLSNSTDPGLKIESIVYGPTLNGPDFALADGEVAARVASAENGELKVPVTAAVAKDVAARVERGNRSQFRLRFRFDSVVDTVLNRVTFASGNSTVVAQRPSLMVVYRHP